MSTSVSVAPSQRYSARRRGGLRGRLSLLRGAVCDGEGRELLWAKSPQLAALLASALNGDLQPRQVERPSGLARYSVQTGPSNPKRHNIWGIVGTVRDQALFGHGRIAVTDDAELAQRLVTLLNDVDPERFKRSSGIGWF